MAGYARELSARRDPIASTLASLYERVRRRPKRIVFAEAEEEQVLRAALSYANQELGTALLLGREDLIRATAERAGIDLNRPGLEIVNARISTRVEAYIDYLYARLQRKGYLHRDAQRLIHNDRNHFAATMVALGDADGMVTGITRNYSTALEDVRRCIDAKPGHRVIGVSLALCRGRTVFVADTAVHDMPSAEELADIAEEAAGLARRMGYPPRVALLAYSTFGHPSGERSERVREAVKILDKRRVEFEYDGEMAADVALNRKVMEQYPFCRLSGPANVLVMPAFHSASISTKMLQELGGSTVIGPILVASTRPCRSPRWEPRTATSSTWRRSPPTGRGRKACQHTAFSREIGGPGRQPPAATNRARATGADPAGVRVRRSRGASLTRGSCRRSRRHGAPKRGSSTSSGDDLGKATAIAQIVISSRSGRRRRRNSSDSGRKCWRSAVRSARLSC